MESNTRIEALGRPSKFLRCVDWRSKILMQFVSVLRVESAD
jgi:hypothetical protein